MKKNSIEIIVITLLLLIIYALTYIIGYKSASYQGKTAQEWASLDKADQQVALQKGIEQGKIDQIEWIDAHPIPSPTPIIQYVTQPSVTQPTPAVELPPYCALSIANYMSLGFSRSMTNQLLKGSMPQCAY